MHEAVEYWHSHGFPYYQLSDKQINQEILYLRGYDPQRAFSGQELVANNLGLRLVNFFHPRMWHVRCTRYRSPFETFSDKNALGRAIKRSLEIWPDRYGANASSLRRILKSFSNTVGVSNFRPNVALGILDRYSQPGDHVLDFAAGYGGRMVAALTLGRQYLGIDPGVQQVRGLRRLASYCCRSHSSGLPLIKRAAAEDIMPTLKAESFDLIFSSPPYFHREKYGYESEQSFIRYPTLEQWLDRFLRVVIEQSRRLLRPNGYLVLNVNDGKAGIAPATREIASVGFQRICEWRMRLAKLPYKRSAPEEAYKWEPVIVFRKHRNR